MCRELWLSSATYLCEFALLVAMKKLKYPNFFILSNMTGNGAEILQYLTKNIMRRSEKALIQTSLLPYIVP